MVVISLDSIVKNVLLKRGYSLHFYLDFLVYGKDIFRAIAMDDGIQTLRRQVLQVDQTTHTIAIPNDYLDYTGVYLRTNQYLRPLVEDDSLDLIPNYDSNFQVQPYADGIASQSASTDSTFYPMTSNSGYWWMVNWNSFGENLGRQFGGTGNYIDTFRVDKANNQIKINERLAATEILLEYISDGMDADSATHIDAYAQDAIEAGMLWQFYLNNRSYQTYDVQTQFNNYMNERKILRARLSDLTIDKLKRIVQGNSIRVKY